MIEYEQKQPKNKKPQKSFCSKISKKMYEKCM